MQTRSVPFWISAFIHLMVIGVAGILFIKPPEFAIATGHDSVEVSLVAAAPDPTPTPPPVTQPEEQAMTEPPKPDDVVVPVSRPTPPITPPPTPVEKVTPTPPLVAVRPKPHRTPTVARGDGSAPKPGKDVVTASSDGGAIMEAKPDYLSNPPPNYPESCRWAKQEGVVVLAVIVNLEGRPDSITIQASSGFSPLDRSAVTAVNRWRFKPAMLGTIKVKSRVVIPVRFRLEDQ